MGRKAGAGMTFRSEEIDRFLKAFGYESWQRNDLAGDASMRRYERISGPKGQNLVLMDAPPETNCALTPYLEVTEILQGLGVSVPRILHADQKAGLLLIEDLGDDLFATLIARSPDREQQLYAAATDLLVDIHARPCPNLPPLGPRIMAEMTSLAFTEYRSSALGDDAPEARQRFEDRFEDILKDSLSGQMVFVHRDFHAQNLLWLSDRHGAERVGVIDFQDARSGHPAYDLVSLLQDARRDVPAGIEAEMIQRYLDATGLDDHAFRTAYAVIGVQRNMRILGIFARLARQNNKTKYLDLMPRVWAHFIRGLDHPALALVAAELRTALPAPDPDILRKLHP